MAIYSFQHGSVSLKRHGPGRAAAAVRYITRGVADYIGSIGFSHSKHDARRQMQAIEDAQKRKDARIIHTFIVAMPAELSLDQNIGLADAFAWALTKQGKAWAEYAIHGEGTINPHLHVLLVDREVTLTKHRAISDDTGRWQTMWVADLGPSVNKLTHSASQRVAEGLNPNATEWCRELWERIGNNHLEAAGFEPSLDRRSLFEQGIDRQAEAHRGPDASERPELPVEDSEIDNHVLDETSEEEMSYIVHGKPLESKQTHERVRDAVSSQYELQILQSERAWLRELQSAATAAELQAEAAQRELSAARVDDQRSDRYLEQAKGYLAANLREDGTLKGFHFKLWRWEFKSSARVAAEIASDQALIANDEKARSSQLVTERDQDAQRKERLRYEAQEARGKLELKLRAIGTEKELDEAQALLEMTVAKNLEDITIDMLREEFENGLLTEVEYEKALETMHELEELERVRDERDTDITE